MGRKVWAKIGGEIGIWENAKFLMGKMGPYWGEWPGSLTNQNFLNT